MEGILASFNDAKEHFRPPVKPVEQNANLVVEPAALIACVHKNQSANLLSQKFGHFELVTVLANENVRGIKQGDIVVLGVEPSIYCEVLAEPGVRDALRGKILVSILGGVSTSKLHSAILGDHASSLTEEERQNYCHVIRVTPSTAAAVRESVSLINGEEQYQYPPEILNAVHSLFLRVGQVKIWSETLQPAGATLIAGSIAFLSLALEGLVESAVRQGIEKDEAFQMGAAAMLGLSKLVARGEDMAEIRRKVATPGGGCNFQ